MVTGTLVREITPANPYSFRFTAVAMIQDRKPVISGCTDNGSHGDHGRSIDSYIITTSVFL
jgi:hypothetical protein